MDLPSLRSYQKSLSYEKLSQEDSIPRSSSSSNGQLGRSAYLVVVAVVAVSLLVVTAICSRFSFGSSSLSSHQQVVPTLLSIVHPETKSLLNALENDVYKKMKSATFHRRSMNDGIVDYPQLHLDRIELLVRDPLTLTWTDGSDTEGKPVVGDADVLLLHCGAEDVLQHDLNKRKILEAATIAQVKATSQFQGTPLDSMAETNRWFFPKFPVLRQEACQFVLVQSEEKSSSSSHYHVIAESDIFHLSYVTTPTAIHLSLTNDPTEMMVSFVTGGSGKPVVMYGVEKDDTNLPERVTGSSDTYTADDLCQEPGNVTETGKFLPPGQLHSVKLSGLKPRTAYQYKVGLQTGQGVSWSEETFVFSSPVIPGDSEPFSYIVYGDQGCPSDGWGSGGEWTAAMASREIENRQDLPIRAVHHFGDLSYAKGAAHIWDDWFEMIQPIASRVPYMVAVGNHEYDHYDGGVGKDPSGVLESHGFMPTWGNFYNDSGGECGVPTAKRFTMPESETSNGVFWYSYDFGSVHTAVLSSEHDMSYGSPQHAWLESDLASVDRQSTPWVVVELHRPLYEAEDFFPNTNNAVGIAMRYAIEDMLHDYSVDLVLSGHYHAYLRTCDGLYHSQCGNGGPTYITVGAAGAVLDEATLYQNSWTERFIQQEYGYGRISVMNASALHFEFVKAGDTNDTSAGAVHDETWLIRDR